MKSPCEKMKRKRERLVGIVVVSHSNRLAEELINFAKILQQEEFNLENGGNLKIGAYGTTVDTVTEAIRKADEGEGVLVFADMGSSVFNAVKAVEKIDGEIAVEIADAPLVEGLISAAAANYGNMSLKDLKEIAEGSRSFIKLKNRRKV